MRPLASRPKSGLAASFRCQASKFCPAAARAENLRLSVEVDRNIDRIAGATTTVVVGKVVPLADHAEGRRSGQGDADFLIVGVKAMLWLIMEAVEDVPGGGVSKLLTNAASLLAL